MEGNTMDRLSIYSLQFNSFAEFHNFCEDQALFTTLSESEQHELYNKLFNLYQATPRLDRFPVLDIPSYQYTL